MRTKAIIAARSCKWLITYSFQSIINARYEEICANVQSTVSRSWAYHEWLALPRDPPKRLRLKRGAVNALNIITIVGLNEPPPRILDPLKLQTNISRLLQGLTRQMVQFDGTILK